MPRYKVMATEYIYKDAYVDAKDAEEAVQIAENLGNFIIVGGDFQIHADMTVEEERDGKDEKNTR